MMIVTLGVLVVVIVIVTVGVLVVVIVIVTVGVLVVVIVIVIVIPAFLITGLTHGLAYMFEPYK